MIECRGVAPSGADQGHGSIVINGRFLEKRMFGIGRFATDLARRLCETDKAVVLASSSTAHAGTRSGLQQAIQVVRPFRGHLWEQLTLPTALVRRGRSLLLNFVNTAPILYSPQVSVLYDISYARQPEAFRWWYRFYYSAVIPWTVRRSNRIVTISEFVKRELVSEMGASADRVDVVYPFVAPALRTLAERVTGAGSARPYILAVGSANPRKNLARLINAMSLLQDLDIELHVIGGKPNVFRSEGVAYQERSNVLYLGAVSDAELVAQYKGASAFVFPSLYEGFGIPPLEAMVCGCPVVASFSSSVPEACGDAAEYVDPCSEHDIARGIRAVITSADYRGALVARGKAHADRFTLDCSLMALQSSLRRAVET